MAKRKETKKKKESGRAESGEILAETRIPAQPQGNLLEVWTVGGRYLQAIIDDSQIDTVTNAINSERPLSLLLADGRRRGGVGGKQIADWMMTPLEMLQQQSQAQAPPPPQEGGETESTEEAEAPVEAGGPTDLPVDLTAALKKRSKGGKEDAQAPS